ncbi:MAG: PKD domain-containing protein, partial [Bacteroidetes bacterium]|nr:PKD domain-containing protein [Bacteroidota bacterium]
GTLYLHLNVNETPNKFEPIDSLQAMYDSWKNNCNPVAASFTQSVDSVNTAINEKVDLISTSTDALIWRWDLGDGNFRPGETIIYKYDSVGTHTIQLVGQNRNCTDTTTSTIVAYNDCNAVQAAFTQSADTISLATSNGEINFFSDSL